MIIGDNYKIIKFEGKNFEILREAVYHYAEMHKKFDEMHEYRCTHKRKGKKYRELEQQSNMHRYSYLEDCWILAILMDTFDYRIIPCIQYAYNTCKTVNPDNEYLTYELENNPSSFKIETSRRIKAA